VRPRLLRALGSRVKRSRAKHPRTKVIAPLSPVALIAKKRDGQKHDEAELHALVSGLMNGAVTDYQMTAWLMAAYLNGIDEREMVALTDAMLLSGDVLELRSVDRPKVDKHSTGGVGDKISLCLGPLVAACGAAVPMIAGRGLGHTGGTLDKLEAIPGYEVKLSAKRFEQVVREAGVSIIGQTEHLAPADRRIYALRDVTGTVECIPLIVASILSKKLAEGIDALVLDVKVGRGAFMKDLQAATELSRALVRVGKRAGKRVSALLTDMSAPIGLTVGNALELREAIDVLLGGGPPDTRELTLLLGEEMLVAVGLAKTRSQARRALIRAIDDGSGLETLARMVRLQDGDDRYVTQPSRLPKAPVVLAVPSPRTGFVSAIDARSLGELAVAIGAGRKRAEDPVDPRVGIELCVKPGGRVTTGQPLALLHLASRRHADACRQACASAFTFSRVEPGQKPLVLRRSR
jgi:pyrimidine-nucleoside phosphorylase